MIFKHHFIDKTIFTHSKYKWVYEQSCLSQIKRLQKTV